MAEVIDAEQGRKRQKRRERDISAGHERSMPFLLLIILLVLPGECKGKVFAYYITLTYFGIFTLGLRHRGHGDVAQLAESWIVYPVVVGSNPIIPEAYMVGLKMTKGLASPSTSPGGASRQKRTIFTKEYEMPKNIMICTNCGKKFDPDLRFITFEDLKYENDGDIKREYGYFCSRECLLSHLTEQSLD